jgi:hypothetical protein
MYELNDHPDIAHAMRTGEPGQEECEVEQCPICHSEAETIYCDRDGVVFGCNECIEIRFVR